MSFQRSDVDATAQEKYVADLQSRVTALSAKSWSELTLAEKDVIAELAALKAGCVKAPGGP